MGLHELYADLGGSSTPVSWPDPRDEAAANLAVRNALGRLLRARQKRDQQAGLAIYAKYFGRGEPQSRQLVARGLRRLRADPEVRRSIIKGKPEPIAKRGPGPGWIPIAEAAKLTGYTEEHIRTWVSKRIGRRKVNGLLYLNRSELIRYARAMKRKGYGPKQ